MKRTDNLNEALRQAGINVRPRWQRIINAPVAWVLLFVDLMRLGRGPLYAARLATKAAWEIVKS